MSEESLPEPFDAGDAKAVRGKNKKDRLLLESQQAVLRTMLATEDHRKFWWDLISDCGVFRANLVSQEQMYYNEGRRNVGLQLLSYIPTDLYRMMQDEAEARRKTDAA